MTEDEYWTISNRLWRAFHDSLTPDVAALFRSRCQRIARNLVHESDFLNTEPLEADIVSCHSDSIIDEVEDFGMGGRRRSASCAAGSNRKGRSASEDTYFLCGVCAKKKGSEGFRRKKQADVRGHLILAHHVEPRGWKETEAGEKVSTRHHTAAAAVIAEKAGELEHKMSMDRERYHQRKDKKAASSSRGGNGKRNHQDGRSSRMSRPRDRRYSRDSSHRPSHRRRTEREASRSTSGSYRSSSSESERSADEDAADAGDASSSKVGLGRKSGNNGTPVAPGTGQPGSSSGGGAGHGYEDVSGTEEGGQRCSGDAGVADQGGASAGIEIQADSAPGSSSMEYAGSGDVRWTAFDVAGVAATLRNQGMTDITVAQLAQAVLAIRAGASTASVIASTPAGQAVGGDQLSPPSLVAVDDVTPGAAGGVGLGADQSAMMPSSTLPPLFMQGDVMPNLTAVEGGDLGQGTVSGEHGLMSSASFGQFADLISKKEVTVERLEASLSQAEGIVLSGVVQNVGGQAASSRWHPENL